MLKRILFVDDNAMVLDIYRKVFSRKGDGWQCFYANDAMSAIDILDFSAIDIIITDLDMPMYNGAQLLNLVREKHPGVTRIVFSGSRSVKQNMQTVNCAHRFIAKPNTIGDLERMIEKIYHLYRQLVDQKTRAIINGIDRLPALPSVYLDLLEEFSSPDYSLKRVGELISSDIGMTTEILKMANSAYFGLNESVSSAQQAVTLLGGNIVKGLILTAHISRSFTKDEQQVFSVESWENHSLLCGIFCQVIAQYEKKSIKDQETAFVSGILHDVGRIILATSFPEKYRRVLDIAGATHQYLQDVEKQVINATHSAVGAYLLGLWGLPDQVVELVAVHHNPSNYTGDNPEMALILHAADILTYELVPEFNPGGLPLPEKRAFVGDMANKVNVWRDHCAKEGVKRGYLSSEPETHSEVNLTPMGEAPSSIFIHGYDDLD